MAPKMTEIDTEERLDDLSMEILELMQKLTLVKVELENRMREGNLLLAKARYARGTNSFSQLQLPTEDSEVEFESNVKVQRSEEERKFEIVKGTKNEEESSSSDIRRRGAQNSEVREIEAEKPKNHDPLKWFGILVPTSVRQCQNAYERSIELTVEAASLELELNSLMKEYQKLSSC